jgi:hypothetical protein
MLGDSRAYDFTAIASSLIAHEAPPSWRRRIRSSYHMVGDHSLADLDAELEQLTVEAHPRAAVISGSDRRQIHLPHLWLLKT